MFSGQVSNFSPGLDGHTASKTEFKPTPYSNVRGYLLNAFNKISVEQADLKRKPTLNAEDLNNIFGDNIATEEQELTLMPKSVREEESQADTSRRESCERSKCKLKIFERRVKPRDEQTEEEGTPTKKVTSIDFLSIKNNLKLKRLMNASPRNGANEQAIRHLHPSKLS